MIAVEDQRAGTGLGDRAVAADGAVVGDRVRAAEDQALLSRTFPAIMPVFPPASICSVPLLIVVPPV